ncbi:diablo IAP-binding mitochondrial protein-like [Genypterus blacodes]|uniref:diablo IAP-binding mitochondrial protein-like n=1 Tax=Genypterus blacodes TaxID=154954 RepID=UPI003F777B0C
MAAVRRGAACLRFLRKHVNVLFSNGKPAVHRLSKWTGITHRHVVFLSVGGGLCAVPFRQTESLSHESLIRRAASLVTDSSSTFLSQTTLALLDAFTQYSKAVHTLIGLHKRYLASLGKLTPAEEDSIWQVIIGQRAEVNERVNECKSFESSWFNAVKLCETAAEAAYNSGAEQASVTVMTNIQLATSQVEDARKISVNADKMLAEAKVMEVEKMTAYSSTQENDDEEEIPEAYLRED